MLHTRLNSDTITDVYASLVSDNVKAPLINGLVFCPIRYHRVSYRGGSRTSMSIIMQAVMWRLLYRFKVTHNSYYNGPVYITPSSCCGSAFSVVAGVPYDDFEVVSGESDIRYYVKSETGTSAFCGNCGSSLFGDRSDKKMIHLSAVTSSLNHLAEQKQPKERNLL